jgi:2-phosphosulfolactate phosphatase
MPAVSVHFLPNLFQPHDLRGGIAVAIDVLRASTTIVHALAAGAKAVVPCEDVDEARRAAANLPASDVVLGGERGGVLIDGFDLDNSPAAYTPQTVKRKTVVFTTTNGTRALLRCREADRVLIGAFVNLQAVVDAVLETGRPVHLVCAGTCGEITAEDVLCAGAFVDSIIQFEPRTQLANDSAQIAVEFFQQSMRTGKLAAALQRSLGGRNLRELGFDADIELAAERDRFDVVPEFVPREKRIVTAGTHAVRTNDKPRSVGVME